MGTGFTIETPLKVAKYGISSVVSLVDDMLIEQMRTKISATLGRSCDEISSRSEDARSRRITAYLNLMHDRVEEQIASLRASVFEKGSELSEYFEMLPPSPLRTAYETMLSVGDPDTRARLQDELRRRVVPGDIDVNIMTKLDRDRFKGGQSLGPKFSDAMTALRGFAESKLSSSVVLSAGMNAKLYAYLAEFTDFLPDDTGNLKKKIILKVSDFRSALIQGRMLARKGLWVSEFRVESGLNCGGHAFGVKGQLMGPILNEFHTSRDSLVTQLHTACNKAREKMGTPLLSSPPPTRITVQGGIGTAEENTMLHNMYGVDGTGWASPFLMVPEVVSIDEDHLHRVTVAGEDDVHLSNASPLGVPFWCLKTAESEVQRRARIDDGSPGSTCPKGYLVSNTEFTEKPICTASRAYQKLKTQELGKLVSNVTDKACICHDLAGGATKPAGIDPDASTAVCCGPNTVYFERVAAMKEMIDHIYGRAKLPLNAERPHMFIKELSLHLHKLREDLGDKLDTASKAAMETRENLVLGILYYQEQTAQLTADKREVFVTQLEAMRKELDRILPKENQVSA
jgi:hypothetical protein